MGFNHTDKASIIVRTTCYVSSFEVYRLMNECPYSVCSTDPLYRLAGGSSSGAFSGFGANRCRFLRVPFGRSHLGLAALHDGSRHSSHPSAAPHYPPGALPRDHSLPINLPELPAVPPKPSRKLHLLKHSWVERVLLQPSQALLPKAPALQRGDKAWIVHGKIRRLSSFETTLSISRPILSVIYFPLLSCNLE